MALDNPDRVESEAFLEKYEPIDIGQDPLLLRIKDISEEFYSACEQLQDDILKGRVTNTDEFKEEQEFVTGGINAGVLKLLGGSFNLGDFIRTKLFKVRQEWINATPRGKALKELEVPNAILDELYNFIKQQSQSGGKNGLSDISEEGLGLIIGYITTNINSFPKGTTDYFTQIFNDIDVDTMRISRIISFLKEYRIKVGIEAVKGELVRVMS